MSASGHLGPPDWLTLDSDESLRVRARPSKNLLLGTFVIGTALLLGVGVLAILADIDIMTGRLLSFVVLLVIVVMTGSVYLVTRRREYVVTSRRVCEAVGLLSKQVSAVDLDEVADVSVEQSDWQGWLNVGSLRFVTDDGNAVRFALVENPQWVYERTLESLESAD